MGQGEIKPFWTFMPLFKGGWKRLSAFLKRRAKVSGRVSKLTTVYYCTVPPLNNELPGRPTVHVTTAKGTSRNKTSRERGTIKKRLTANTAREGLSEVRQEPVNLCKRLGVSGVVVEH